MFITTTVVGHLVHLSLVACLEPFPLLPAPQSCSGSGVRAAKPASAVRLLASSAVGSCPSGHACVSSGLPGVPQIQRKHPTTTHSLMLPLPETWEYCILYRFSRGHIWAILQRAGTAQWLAASKFTLQQFLASRSPEASVLFVLAKHTHLVETPCTSPNCLAMMRLIV